jgi:Uma2 family endonuclease
MVAKPVVIDPDDLLELPEPEEGGGWELVDGELVVCMTGGSFLHSRMLLRVAALMDRHVRDHQLPGEVFPEISCVLSLRRDPLRVRIPDISFVHSAKLVGVDTARIFRGVPDLVVEIDVSGRGTPVSRRRIVDYMEAGVSLIWVIEPEMSTAMVYRPDGSARLLRKQDVLDAEDVIPGFRLPLDELFATA